MVVTSTIGGYKGDGMQVNIHVCFTNLFLQSPIRDILIDPDVIQIRDSDGNEYARPRDVVGESRAVFTSHNDSPFDVCYENIYTSCMLPSFVSR